MRTALVTGANRGIGLALTKELLHRGYTVHATHRRDIGGLATIDHEHLLTHAMDVRDPDAIHAVVDRVGPRLDLLINNAAVYDGRSRGLTDLDVPFLREAFDVNTLGPLQMVHASLGPLSTANGCVVMISTGMSSITDRPDSNALAYRISKAGLNMLTVALTDALSARGVSVALLGPGWVATDMGGPGAPLSPATSASGILDRAEEIELGAPVQFMAYDGVPIPW